MRGGTSSHRPRSVVIAGASEGIGASMALWFASQGLSVGLLARNEARLLEVSRQCRDLGAPSVHHRAVDVTRSQELRTALAKLDSHLDGVDVFVANAGSGYMSDPHCDEGQLACELIALNLSAAIDSIEFMKPRMVERGGIIAAVTSVAGARGLPATPVYCATKAGLGTYLEALRIQLRPHGVSVVELAPGFVDTRLTRAVSHPMPFLLDAKQAGQLLARAVLRRSRRYVAPWPFRAVYLLLRYTPGPIYELLARFLPRDERKK